jgi:hypothetical protein
VPERRTEAIGRIETTAALDPRPDQLIEDLAIRKDARERLEKLRRERDRAALPSSRPGPA